MSRATTIAIGALVVVLTGCSAGSPAAPASSASHAISSSSDTPGSSSGLRGYPVASMDCAKYPTPTSFAAVPITGAVEMVRICPPATKPGLNAPAQVDVTAVSEPEKMQALTAALSESDGPSPSSSPVVCLTYGQMPVELLVKTADGQWSAYLPRDFCGHWLHPLVQAMQAARA
jgi:hypothetical protein